MYVISLFVRCMITVKWQMIIAVLTQTYVGTHRDTHTHIETETHTHTQRHTDTHTERHTQTHKITLTCLTRSRHTQTCRRCSRSRTENTAYPSGSHGPGDKQQDHYCYNVTDMNDETTLLERKVSSIDLQC